MSIFVGGDCHHTNEFNMKKGAMAIAPYGE